LQTSIEGEPEVSPADVFGLSVALGVCCFLLTTLFGMMFFLRILFAMILGFAPVVYIMRERLNMAAKLKAHTAQQRFSAAFLGCLPLVVGIGFWILKPDYVRLLWTDPVGIKFFTYAICSEIVGILVIRKLANIKV